MAKLPTPSDDELPWRSVTVSADKVRGPEWEELRKEHQRQFAHGTSRGIKIYWREDDSGEYTFVFSPSAALDARDRLKGIPLQKIEAPDLEELAEDGFLLTDRIG